MELVRCETYTHGPYSSAGGRAFLDEIHDQSWGGVIDSGDVNKKKIIQEIRKCTKKKAQKTENLSYQKT